MRLLPTHKIFRRVSGVAPVLSRGLTALLLFLFLQRIDAQQFTVSGVVLSGEYNQPLIGVSVQEKGASNGVTTDAAGAFRLDVASAEAVLLFRYIGFADLEMPVQGRATLSVVMGAAAISTNAGSWNFE